MSAIHQMYCTHCTHGSSALERRQGELAARTLGYSVRAGSLEPELLRQAYRQMERYVSYHLPQDAPAESKLRLTAETAPRRLFFVPAAGPWQVMGQACYRQRDSEGRPGSYFAHLVFQRAGQETRPWTLVDVLRLWDAPGWVREDSPDHPFVLPLIEELDALLVGAAPTIGDEVLSAFLRGEELSARQLPARWREVPSASRVELMRRMLSGLLSVGTTRRQSLLAAVEPEMAALLFFGVGRLLPPGPLRASASVSTFEASPDRLTTCLAATTFCEPSTAEFRSDALRGRGLAMNTFREPWFSADRESGAYAERIVQRYLHEGPRSADRRLAMIAATRPKRIEALNDLAQTEAAVESLFVPSGEVKSAVWQSDATATDFARRLVRERLAALSDAEAALGGLCGGANHEAILTLAATASPGERTDRAIRFLLSRMPEEQIAPFIVRAEIDDFWKAEMLSARIESSGKTPAGCGWIWNAPDGHLPLSAERQTRIAVEIMGRLPATAVVALLADLEYAGQSVALARLLSACRRNDACWDVFVDVLSQLDVEALLDFYRRVGDDLFELPMRERLVLGERLQGLLQSLPENAGDFTRRLEFLEAGAVLLPEQRDRNELEAWKRCRSAILELEDVCSGGGGWRQVMLVRRLEAVAKRMVEATLEAMPADRFEDDRQGKAKEKCLRDLGRHLTGGAAFLPESDWRNEALWKKIRWRYEMGSWSSVPLRKLTRVPTQRTQMWISVAIAVVVVLGVLGVIGLATAGSGGKPSTGLVVERGGEPDDRSPAATGPTMDTPDAEAERPAEPSTTLSSSEVSVAQAVAPVSAGGREPQVGEQVVEEPLVYEPESPSSDAQAGLPSEAAQPEQAIVPIRGEFVAEMSRASGLTRPIVAVLELRIRMEDGAVLPEPLLERYLIGAVVRERGSERPTEYIDLPNILAAYRVHLADGVDEVLVQFRFSRKAADAAAGSGGIVAVSYSWAKLKIAPAQRYELHFELPKRAVKELEGLVAGEE